MILIRWLTSLAALMTIGTSMAAGDDFPHKTVRLITAPPGGSSDFFTRLIAQGLTASMGQTVIVDNRNAEILGDLVSKASPDGYTMLLMGSVIWIVPMIRAKTSYDPVRDLAPISLVATEPNMLVVHPSLGIKSVGELVALAKSRPSVLNYATGGTGSAAHLAGELFKSMARINMVNIAYAGGGPAITATIGGEVQLMFPSAASVLPHVKAGRLSGLATTGARPSALYPSLPTVAASGLPGFQVESIIGMWVPAKTPERITIRLNQEVVKVLNQPTIKEKFLNVGVEPAPCSREQFATLIASEMTRWGKVIKEAGIRID